MESKDIYPFSLVNFANENLKKYDKELQIVRHEDGYYGLDILTINPDGNAETGTVKEIETYAENYFENELEELVRDAYHFVRENEEFKRENDELFCYRIIHGGTHGMPALIYTLTEFSVFFRYKDGTIENIDKHDEGIDYYENEEGDFCMLADEYEIAVRHVEDHDERGVDW